MSSDKGNYSVLRVRKPAYIELSQGARMKIAQKQLQPHPLPLPVNGEGRMRLDPLPGKYQRGDCVDSRIFAAGVTGKILGLANGHGVYHVLGSDGKRYVCHVDYMRPVKPIRVVREFKAVRPKPNVIFIPGSQAGTHPKAWGMPKWSAAEHAEERLEERIRQSNERMRANYQDIYNRRKASAMGGR